MFYPAVKADHLDQSNTPGMTDYDIQSEMPDPRDPILFNRSGRAL